MGEATESLLERARSGDEEALGRLLERHRDFLRGIARPLIGRALRPRADPSDLVQDTFLKAHRQFPRFAGAGGPELAAWLRKILARTLADRVKHDRRDRRDGRRQESLDSLLNGPGPAGRQALASTGSTPSARASRREQASLLAAALARLPEDYREVFLLRSLEHIPFDQVATRMGRSPGAARKLWARALLALRPLLEMPHDP